MERRSSMAAVIFVSVLVGFLFDVRTSRADNSVTVTHGEGACGQGAGYEVSFNGTYSADGYPFGFPWFRAPVILGQCQAATNQGPALGVVNSLDADLDGEGGVSVTISMPATPSRPPANPYLIGWYAWFILGYEEGGTRYYVVCSPQYFISYTGSCFAAGTPVLTPEGSRPIEQLRAGDLVLSSPENSGDGQIEARCIKEVVRSRAKLVEITVGGHVIEASREHPLFVRGKSWTSAAYVTPGDLLRTHDGRWVPIEAVTEQRESQV